MNSDIMDKEIKEMFNKILGPIGQHNIETSLSESDSDRIVRIYDSIHEFFTLPTYIVDSDKAFHSKIAFLIYHKESCDMILQSFIQALSGHYNAANTLLRAAFELYIRGTFYNCLVYEKYRCKLDLKTRKGKYTIRKIIDDGIKENPERYNIEELSTKILFIIDPLIQEYECDKRYHLPSFRDIIKNLVEWNLFDPMDKKEPIDKTVNEIYDIYKVLSKNVHAKYYSTDIIRRISTGNDMFETRVIMEDLAFYLINLHAIIDIGTLIEFNVLKDSISNDLEIKNKLKSRLGTLDNLNLYYTYKAINEYVKE